MKNEVIKDITSIDFICALFGMLRLQNIREFETYTLEQHLICEFERNETLRVMFSEIDPRTIVMEGLSLLSILSAGEFILYSSPKARLKFTRENAEHFIKRLSPVQKELLENLVDKFLHPELTERNALGRKVKI